MAKFTFIRTNPGDPRRKAIEQDNADVILAGFNGCSVEIRARLVSFFADRQQESVMFGFPAVGETVEVWRG